MQQAANYYGDKGGNALALAFIDEAYRVLRVVTASPLMGSAFDGRFRQYALRRFPYKVFYEVATSEVRVFAVAHHRRRPGYWMQRAKNMH